MKRINNNLKNSTKKTGAMAGSKGTKKVGAMVKGKKHGKKSY